MVENEFKYPIRVAAERSGVAVDTLRAWERRYDAVQPGRTDTARRMYSESDIRRLRLLRELVGRGFGIGSVARLPEAELLSLLETGRPEPAVGIEALAAGGAPEEAISRELALAHGALAAMDARALRQLLTRAMLELGHDRVIEHVIAPLCRSIGDQWEGGAISVAHEHVASVALRSALGGMLDALYMTGRGPALIVTTPAGERHEFGAMMATAVALSAGWGASYLGADLPARDVATAANQLGAGVLLLSIVRTDEDDALDTELHRLRAALGPGTAILAGGAGAPSHRHALDAIHARIVPDFATLRQALSRHAAAGMPWHT